MVGWNDVKVRPFQEKDIEPLLDYYYRSSRELPSIQVIDFDKFPKESEYRQKLFDILKDPSGLPTVTVEHLGRPIGVHLLNDVRADQAEFHAHFWSADARGFGIGPISWYKACQYFFDLFPSLQTLFFKAPKFNLYSARSVKKLPLKYVGEEELASPVLKPGIKADVYSLTRAEFEALHSEDESDLDEIE